MVSILRWVEMMDMISAVFWHKDVSHIYVIRRYEHKRVFLNATSCFARNHAFSFLKHHDLVMSITFSFSWNFQLNSRNCVAYDINLSDKRTYPTYASMSEINSCSEYEQFSSGRTYPSYARLYKNWMVVFRYGVGPHISLVHFYCEWPVCKSFTRVNSCE